MFYKQLCLHMNMAVHISGSISMTTTSCGVSVTHTSIGYRSGIVIIRWGLNPSRTASLHISTRLQYGNHTHHCNKREFWQGFLYMINYFKIHHRHYIALSCILETCSMTCTILFFPNAYGKGMWARGEMLKHASHWVTE